MLYVAVGFGFLILGYILGSTRSTTIRETKTYISVNSPQLGKSQIDKLTKEDQAEQAELLRSIQEQENEKRNNYFLDLALKKSGINRPPPGKTQ